MSGSDEQKLKLALNLLAPSHITDEQWREIREQHRRRCDEEELERKWQVLHGWKDPRTTTCRVCSGRVVSDVRREFDRSQPIRYGGPPVACRTIHDGYYCEGCGIRYKMLVGEIVTMTREELERHA